MKDLSELIEDVRGATGADNGLDVSIAVATFQPDAEYSAVRANAAGTKIICTKPDGTERTYLADDYTLSVRSRARTLAFLLAMQATGAK